jgi:aryl-alcohol dehydrogenase-like predicted oxidoreductase
MHPMKYTTLGHTGVTVSRLALGAMTFANEPGAMPGIYKTGQDAAKELVGKALEAGVNFFDTADAYAAGQSEAILGKALAPHRDSVVISTKIGFRVSGDAMIQAGLSYRRVIEAVEASLRRLGTDYIDLLSLHTVDPFTPIEETLRALEWCVQRGYVRYLGYSNYPAWLAATMLGEQKARGWNTMQAAQMYYSMLGRDLEYEHAPFAKYAKISNVIWSPLAGGFLTGKYTREDASGGGGRLASFDFIPFEKERAFDVLDRLKAMAAARNITVARLAIAWLLAKEHADIVLLGASKVPQLEDTLLAADVTLSADEVREIDALTQLRETYPQWYLHQVGADAKISEALRSGGSAL